MSANPYHEQNNLNSLLQRVNLSRGMMFGVILITALLAFEMFNYSTTDFALTDLLGDLSFAGLRWATILSIAFCGIDFAGIARLFTPEGGENPSKEIWYLFGAWMLAAVMNAMLTWWGVSIAILNHETLGNAVVARATLLKIVPIFVAVLVWLIRVLIIGTFSVAGERLFEVNQEQRAGNQRQIQHNPRKPKPAARPLPQPTRQKPAPRPRSPIPRSAQAAGPQKPRKIFAAPKPNFSPAPKPEMELPPNPGEPEFAQMELNYHPSAQINAPSNSHGRSRSEPLPRSWPTGNRKR